jgi:hypothetical protein
MFHSRHQTSFRNIDIHVYINDNDDLGLGFIIGSILLEHFIPPHLHLLQQKSGQKKAQQNKGLF